MMRSPALILFHTIFSKEILRDIPIFLAFHAHFFGSEVYYP